MGMGHTVLIIDDSETVRDRVKQTLSSTEVFERYLMAEDGMAGFKVMVNEKVDLILCDVVMPGFDGFKFLGLKKAKSEFQAIPVIMLTGNDDLETKVRSLTAGASDYLTKPFHEEELVARVRIHMKIKSLQDEMREKNAQLEELTRTDPLTKIPNRRYFMECLDNEFERAQRYGWPLSYVMCDLDHFKSLNDDHGHQAGDTALVMVAAKLVETLRGHDVAGRYGGEEFSMVLPETDGEGAVIVADRCRQVIEDTAFEANGKALKITMSVGVSTYYPKREAPAVERPEQLIKLADEALYVAKDGGRNRVILDESSKNTDPDT
jgi:diguanylate cyclase (GGDEF)-like protein